MRKAALASPAWRETSSHLLFYQQLSFSSAWAGVWEALPPGLWQRFEQRQNCGIVAKRLADVREPIHVTRPEHEASA